MVAQPLMTEQKTPVEPVVDMDWWRGAVIYQIYPRSFQDHNGDGVGDLVGITERLDYVADLGVDAIWLSPFFTSPMKDFGYDVSNYRDVDPIFGTIGDFDRLVDKAHSLKLKVIIDQVISHCSDRHPWFAESRINRTNDKADWFVWADPKPDGTPPNNWLSIFGGSAWTWDSRRMQYYMHNFLASQPDLNFHSPNVQEAQLDNMRFWLERGIDGFRLDTVNFYFHSLGLEDNPVVKPEDFNASTAPAVNPYNFQEHIHDKSQPENAAFMERIRALLDEYGAKTSVGEIGDSQHQLEVMSAYTSGSKRLHMAYTFDYLGGEFSADHFRKAIDATEAAAPDGWVCLAFSNHDVVRHISRWATHGQQEAFTRLACTMLLSMRGSVCLYQGEELGLTEADLAFEDLRDPYGIRFWPQFKGRDGCRTPMVWSAGARNGGFSQERPWLPVPEEHLGKAVDVQRGDENSLLEHYRRFLAFRRLHPALVRGDINFLPSEGETIAFTRGNGTDRLVCVFNLASHPALVDLGSDLRLQPVSGHGFAGEAEAGRVRLGPYGAWFGRMV